VCLWICVYLWWGPHPSSTPRLIHSTKAWLRINFILAENGSSVGMRMSKESCSVLQCVAVCCRVLQSVAECCSVLQRIKHTTTVSVARECYSVLQFVAVRCSVLQCVAGCSSVSNTLRRVCGVHHRANRPQAATSIVVNKYIHTNIYKYIHQYMYL